MLMRIGQRLCAIEFGKIQFAQSIEYSVSISIAVLRMFVWNFIFIVKFICVVVIITSIVSSK